MVLSTSYILLEVIIVHNGGALGRLLLFMLFAERSQKDTVAVVYLTDRVPIFGYDFVRPPVSALSSLSLMLDASEFWSPKLTSLCRLECACSL